MTQLCEDAARVLAQWQHYAILDCHLFEWTVNRDNALDYSHVERCLEAPVGGKSLGPYKILEPLGAGGMGEVYRAHDTNLDRDVASKVLSEDVAHAPSSVSLGRSICSKRG